MQLKQIKKDHWYETAQGVGQALRVGGTRPPSVRFLIVAPFPRGVVSLHPRDILREVAPPEDRTKEVLLP